ncbi:hypothetical protein EYZ11_012939 [Aspergillus tanneri]|uniref:Uncharacterized protein n=1 Tax=Aspergillus tanneri TaxID=1220188 RepID=A0A4S3J137_9EURO|nr:hypothetical protein EYZ11_012939 [Aspergillus tanneri]
MSCEILTHLGIHWDTGRNYICCVRGAVHLPPANTPAVLREFYTSQDHDGQEFRQYIRYYNGQHAPFQIHGQIFHLQGPLLNEDGELPVFAQLWFNDSAYGPLTHMLEQVNPYISLYQTAREQLMAA